MPLPAPYRNPWRNLADDLRAVVADLRLRLQELWRRNREGSLGRPRWWSADLAPLFWPLLLALVLTASAAVATGSVIALRRGVVPAPAPVVADQPAEAEAEIAPAETEADPVQDDLPVSEPPEPEITAPPSAPPLEEPVPLDPLAELLQRPEADGLLLAARLMPDQLSLVLEVAPGFAALSASEQQRRAEQWLQWAQELGYDHLELRDRGSGLLARDALVGGGMIVLSPPSGS